MEGVHALPLCARCLGLYGVSVVVLAVGRWKTSSVKAEHWLGLFLAALLANIAQVVLLEPLLDAPELRFVLGGVVGLSLACWLRARRVPPLWARALGVVSIGLAGASVMLHFQVLGPVAAVLAIVTVTASTGAVLGSHRDKSS